MDVMIFNSKKYFDKLPFNVWIRFDSIPRFIFPMVWDRIEQKVYHRGFDVIISDDFIKFAKIKTAHVNDYYYFKNRLLKNQNNNG
jgi:hypothetical protein